jgi:uncharacterized protein YjbJ (UPF0337 family)
MQLTGCVLALWGKLTFYDFVFVYGNRLKLAGRIQEQYGIAGEVAERLVDYWLGRQ